MGGKGKKIVSGKNKPERETKFRKSYTLKNPRKRNPRKLTTINENLSMNNRRLNYSRIGYTSNPVIVPSKLERTVRVGGKEPTSAQIKNVLHKGRIPRALRGILYIAMTNPIFVKNQEARNEATRYFKEELKKLKSKKQKKTPPRRQYNIV